MEDMGVVVSPSCFCALKTIMFRPAQKPSMKVKKADLEVKIGGGWRRSLYSTLISLSMFIARDYGRLGGGGCSGRTHPAPEKKKFYAFPSNNPTF